MFSQKYLRDDYMSTDSEDTTANNSDDDEENLKAASSSYNQKSYQENSLNSNESRCKNEHEYFVQHKRRDSDTSNNNNNNSNFDRTQPKPSLNTLINSEHTRSNRLNTLINAVNTAPSFSLKSRAFANNSTKKSQDMNMMEFEAATTPYDKTIEVMNANTNDLATQNLLRQLNQHKQKKSVTKSLQDNMNASMSSNKVGNKEIDDEISNNNLATLTVAVLKLLNQLEIKFPGKTNEQTRGMLQKVIFFHWN